MDLIANTWWAWIAVLTPCACYMAYKQILYGRGWGMAHDNNFAALKVSLTTTIVASGILLVISIAINFIEYLVG